MNVLMNLISLYNQLPLDSTYRAVIKGILNNLHELADATIFDMAEITSSSRTTIWRMLKMAGYNSYSEFHHELNKIITQYSYYNWAFPVLPTSNYKDIMTMGPQLLKESAELIEKYITQNLVSDIAKLLYESTHVSFYDFPSICTYFLIQNLSMAGKDVGFFDLLPKMMEDSTRLTEKSVVFAYSVETQDMKDLTPVFKAVQAKGAVLILGSSESSRYISYADYSLFPEDVTLKYPLSRRYAFEIFLLTISEFYRKKYIH